MRLMTKKKAKVPSNVIAQNKRARHDYFIEETLEAGLELQGWELKSIRAGKVNLTETYVIFKTGEAYLLGSQIIPLLSASTHISPDPYRDRKLLLHKKEIIRLNNAKDRDGFTVVALDLHWSRGRVKASIGLAQGKKAHDKRATLKERDWQRDKQRLMKNKVAG